MSRKVSISTTLLLDVPYLGEVEFEADVEADAEAPEPDVGIMGPQIEVTAITVGLPNGKDKTVHFEDLDEGTQNRIEMEIAEYLHDEEEEP